MRPFHTVLLLALAAPMTAAAEKPPYEVVRPGDGQLTCQQLSAEINRLNEAVRTGQQEQAQRDGASRAAKGLLSGLASAAPMLGDKLGGGLAPYALSAAVQGMQAGSTPAAPASASAAPEQQRLDHISELFRDRSC